MMEKKSLLLLSIVFYILLISCSLEASPVFDGINMVATDTIGLTLRQADSLLACGNLSMIAARYQVDAAKAQILQARLFQNPNVNMTAGILNPYNAGFFDTGTEGELAISISQLFRIAGQRYTQTGIAKEAARMSEDEYYDLARTLKLRLHETYFSVYYQEILLKTLEKQLGILGATIDAYEGQHSKGNVALKDLIRLKSQYHQLNDNRTGIMVDISDGYGVLKLLLHNLKVVRPAPAGNELASYETLPSDPEVLVNNALALRPDLKGAEHAVNQQRLQVVLQKKQMVPDLEIQYTYDKNGAYVPHGSLLSVGLSIPLLNQNSGNIRSARAMFNSLQSSYEEKKLQIRNEVEQAYYRLRLTDEQFRKVDADFRGQFDQLNDALMTNYLKHNISLLEFTDLFDAYNESVALLNKIRINRVDAFEELKYNIGN
jgi:cobalt-zinc-cadmium efflux system outer membrane protein